MGPKSNVLPSLFKNICGSSELEPGNNSKPTRQYSFKFIQGTYELKLNIDLINYIQRFYFQPPGPHTPCSTAAISTNN